MKWKDKPDKKGWWWLLLRKHDGDIGKIPVKTIKTSEGMAVLVNNFWYLLKEFSKNMTRKGYKLLWYEIDEPED